ncbi:unnamed protein product [Eruca vesicaria subsp. sativa]|uniref:At2g35280-like TPR domain-containing protein n=1 Tax=Eruca vesicaria subsp. sativa TaxID=29727 RepID=A0ABC8IX23_ERUVS|nr:unnamed protein product [Eruca vesicaria subsp. sativa]
MAHHNPTKILLSLPFFIQIKIMMSIAKHSVESFQNVLTVFPSLGPAAKTPDVLKQLNFHELTTKSLTNILPYHNLLNLSLSVGNLEALYLRGMEEYFKNENITQGLEYLHLAAQGFYDNAIYLYGIIMLSRGHPAIGIPMLDSLNWRDDKARSDVCWQNIKTSLHGVQVKRLDIYITTYKATRATIACHRNDMRRCEACYYFKQMKRFIFIM